MGLLVVWGLTLLNAPAWSQTDPLVTITPTGPVQLVEGGAATTFMISLTSDFLTKLKVQTGRQPVNQGMRLQAEWHF